jgi:hypothetical protein
MTVPNATVDAAVHAGIPRAQVVGGSPYASYPPPQTQETEGLAIASFVCSLIPVMCIGPLLGIVFGHIAMSRIKASAGRLGGKGFAVAGLAIGYIYLVFTVVFGIIWITMYAIIMGAVFTNMECETEWKTELTTEAPPYVEQVDPNGIPVPVAPCQPDSSTPYPAPSQPYPSPYQSTPPSTPYPPAPAWTPAVPGSEQPVMEPVKPEEETPSMAEEGESVPEDGKPADDKPVAETPTEEADKPAEASSSAEGEKTAEEAPAETSETDPEKAVEDAPEETPEKVSGDAPVEEPAKE